MAKTKNDMAAGNLFSPKQGKAQCVVVESEDCRRVKIKWLDENGHSAIVHATALRRGAVKNPYEPLVHNKGFFGVGPFKANTLGKDTKEYKTWSHMMDRCYCDSVKSYPDYGGRGVSVCKEWLNFQTFAAWLTAQPFWGCSNFQLDKDILGNSMEYAPDKCCYIPHQINTAMRSYFDKKAANISVDRRREKVRWQVVSAMLGKRVQVGMFDCQEDAEIASVAAKIGTVVTLAGMFMHLLTRDVYEKLLLWKPAFLSDSV